MGRGTVHTRRSAGLTVWPAPPISPLSPLLFDKCWSGRPAFHTLSVTTVIVFLFLCSRLHFVFFFLDILMVWSLAIFLFLRFAAKHHQEDKNGIKVEKAKEKKRKRVWKKRGQRCCFPRSIVRPAWSVLGRSGPQLGLSRCLKQLRGWARRLSTRPLLGRVLLDQLK